MQTWTCAFCTTKNAERAHTCIMCGTANRTPIKPWSCAVCSFNNTKSKAQCEMCATPKPSPDSEMYVCLGCTARNDPIQHPVQCGVCQAPRYLPHLCKWLRWDQLAAMPVLRDKAFTLIPDVLQIMHTVWPNVSCTFSGDTPPSLTT